MWVCCTYCLYYVNRVLYCVINVEDVISSKGGRMSQGVLIIYCFSSIYSWYCKGAIAHAAGSNWTGHCMLQGTIACGKLRGLSLC